MNFFVINLDETAPDQMSFCSFALSKGYYLMEGPWDDTFVLITIGGSQHGMGFSTTSLSISENGAVIALQYTIDKGKS
jgi:hypothetical protein